MATSYALPPNGSVLAQDPRGAHKHSRSHHRKAAPERLPFVPSPMNGATALANSTKELLNGSHIQSRSLPSNNLPEHRQTKHQHFHSSVQQPIPELESTVFPTFEVTDPNGTPLEPDMHSKMAHDGYGFPRVNDHDHDHDHHDHHDHDRAHEDHDYSSSSWITASEAAAATILPLPYSLMTLMVSQPRQQVLMDSVIAKLAEAVDDSKLDKFNVKPPPALSFTIVCGLTAATLLLIGIIGKVRRPQRTLDRRKSGLDLKGLIHDEEEATITSLMTANTIQRVLFRVLAVGLPFYAAGKIGGARVAFMMLVAMAADLGRVNRKSMDTASFNGWMRSFSTRKWTISVLCTQFVCDVSGLTATTGTWSVLMGYIALALSMSGLQPPYPSGDPKDSIVTSPMPKSRGQTSTVATPWGPPSAFLAPTSHASRSPLISTPKDINLTIIAGLSALVLTGIMFFLSANAGSFSTLVSVQIIVVAFTAAASLVHVDLDTIRTKRILGLALGLILTSLVQEFLQAQTWVASGCQITLAGCSWAALRADCRLALHTKNYRRRADSFLPSKNHSKFTGFVLSITQDWTLLHSILAEKDSRRIFYFMCLNFGFMLVQTFYGVVTGSLGLLSDSIHMFFDCLALVVGLCAAIMSKWPPSVRFPYGFGKMDTLAGFANGIFLMLISVEIVYEAIERLVEGSHMQRIGELLTVSTLGLLVNLVGMFAFGHAHHGHGHGHSHGDHDHSQGAHDHSHETHEHAHGAHDHSHDPHDHSLRGHSEFLDKSVHSHAQHNHSHQANSHASHNSHQVLDNGPRSPLPFNISPITKAVLPLIPAPPKPHSHSHNHGDNMHGIFLHVLADTLGSVAVVISTICIHYTGWAGFDPLASCLIAILIFASAIPLVVSSAKQLLLTVPQDTEFDLREALAGVGGLRGVSGVTAPRFWMREGDDAMVEGVMHVIVSRGVELDDVRERATMFLASRSMDVLVQVEREGEGRCWCGGGMRN